jgi:DNA replication protein DnaC
LQQARQALSLESAIEKLDKYHVLILEDLCYVRKDQAETSVLFELIAARYERRSLIVTASPSYSSHSRDSRNAIVQRIESTHRSGVTTAPST